MEQAVGIVRVSNFDEATAHSPEVQVRAMLLLARQKRYALSAERILDENDIANGNVSGGADLSDRPGLRPAVEMVESGEATVILAERFDRFFRNLDVQREVIRRVEAAGGRIETTAGAISHATAEAELSANLNGSISQYTRRTAKERAWAAVEVAIEEGKVPWYQVPPGYLRVDSRLVPDADAVPLVVHAFEMRAAGEPITAVRAYLRGRGIERSYRAVTDMLKDRIYLGEVHFGTHTPNLAAHEAIVDADLFAQVGAAVVRAGGRRAKSDRLLARLGVLRCATCGSRMTVGSGNRLMHIYRCPGSNDCPRRVTISAPLVEDMVVPVVRDLAEEIRGKASAEDEAIEAQAIAAAAQTALAKLIRTLTAAGVLDEPEAIEQLTAAREARDAAKEDAERALARSMAIEVSTKDWDEMTLTEQRRLVRAVLDRVTVGPARSHARGGDPSRVTIVPKPLV